MIIEFNPKKNQKKSFKKIIASLEKYAIDNNKQSLDVLEGFIKDLENIGVEGYEKKLPVFEIKKGVSEKTTGSLLNYLRTIYKNQRRIEKNKKTVEAATAKKETKPEEKQDDKTEETKSEVEKRKEMFIEAAKEKWQAILSVVDEREKTRLEKIPQNDKKKRDEVRRNVLFECLKSLEKRNEKIQENGGEENYLSKVIRRKLEDELFYEEVKYFTEDFKFLSQNYIFYTAASGHSGRDFIETKDNLKFSFLQSDIQNVMYQEYCGEEKAIEIMLKRNKNAEGTALDGVTRRILQARQNVLAKQEEK